MSEWIKCSEVMPEPFTTVLTYDIDVGGVSMMCWNSGEYWQMVSTNDDLYRPTHWMPLPEPPQ